MRRLTLTEVLTVADLPRFNLDNWRVGKTVALAFGRNVASDALTFLEVDALMLMITKILAESYSRKLAASFGRIHFDIIAQTLAAAEATPELPQFLSVIDFRNRGVLSHTVCGTQTDDAEIISFELAKIPMTAKAFVNRITSINVSALRAEAVANGERKGLDISAPWLPPFGSPELAKLLQPYVETRDGAVSIAVAGGNQSRKIFDAMMPSVAN